MPASTRTACQKRWLCDKFKVFKEHQNNRKLGEFFPALYEEYFTFWPPAPTPEDLEAAEGDEARANAKVRKLEQGCIYRWMHNHARTKHGANGQGSSASMNLTEGPPKKKAPVQTYVKQYWETKVRPEVIKLWAPTPETDLFGEIDNGEDQVAWEAMMPMEKNIPLWFKMKVGRRLYESESDEVKAEIDRLRDQEKEDAVSAHTLVTTFTTDRERIQVMKRFDENFPKLNSALTHLCDNVLRNFGFQTTIIVGGPVVREDGKLGCFTFESSGTILKQLTFSEFCGASETEGIEGKFVEYLKLCYPKGKRQEYTLNPLPPPNTRNVPSVPPDLPHPLASSAPHPPSATGPDRVDRVSKQARLATGPLPLCRKRPASVRTAGADLQTTPDNAPVSPSSECVDQTITANINTSSDAANPNPNVSNDEYHLSDIPGNESHISGALDDKFHLSYTLDSESHLPGALDDGSHLSYSLDSESHLSDAPDIEMGDSEFVITINDNDALAVTTPPTQYAVATRFLPRLGVSALIESGSPALLLADEDVRPDWLLAAVGKYLRYVPYFGCLGKVIDLFLAQEASLGYPNTSKRMALPSTNRPVEVGQFQKWHRDFTRGNNVDSEKFGNSVVTWWLTIQPTTRKQWPPVHDLPPNNLSFDYFNCGGPNGVFLVILCLGWWANSLDVNKNLTDYMMVVNDVRWVLEQIATRA